MALSINNSSTEELAAVTLITTTTDITFGACLTGPVLLGYYGIAMVTQRQKLLE